MKYLIATVHQVWYFIRVNTNRLFSLSASAPDCSFKFCSLGLFSQIIQAFFILPTLFFLVFICSLSPDKTIYFAVFLFRFSRLFSLYSECIHYMYGDYIHYNVFIQEIGGVVPMYDYSPLWETLQRKNISQYYLLSNGIDYRTMDQLRKNKNITIKMIDRLCQLLDCSPNDIVRITPDEPENTETAE